MPSGIYQHESRKPKEIIKCFNCGTIFAAPIYKNRKYCSLHCWATQVAKTRIFTEKTREKFRNAKKGLPPNNAGMKKSDASKLKQSVSMKKSIREHGHPFYKGGVSLISRTERMNIMNSVEYKIWRNSVFERDNFTCQKCNKRGGIYLHAHHKKSFIEYPELRLITENGTTLCDKCHYETHKHNH